MFTDVVEARRASEAAGEAEEREDLLHTFMNSNYKKSYGGRAVNAEETAGLLIALLMAGQHTSSTTSSWFGFFVCREGLQDRLLEEQIKVRGPLGADTPPITVDDLSKMPLLHSCVRETLRLRPPIMQMMRNVRKELTIEANGRKYVSRPQC